jgi:hypothetical protein
MLIPMFKTVGSEVGTSFQFASNAFMYTTASQWFVTAEDFITEWQRTVEKIRNILHIIGNLEGFSGAKRHMRKGYCFFGRKCEKVKP